MSDEVWLLRYTRRGAEGLSYWLDPDPYTTREDAEYEGCCRWAGPTGRGVEALHIQAVAPGIEPDEDRWEAVAAASTCGGVRLNSGDTPSS